MLKHYLVTAINYLLANKLFSIINIAGLSVGLAACLLISLFVQHEMSYDKHWRDSDRIFRITTEYRVPGRQSFPRAGSGSPAIPALKQYFANEIEAATRIFSLPDSTLSFTNKAAYSDSGSLADNRSSSDKKIVETIRAVDREFFDLFQLNVLAGDLASVQRDYNNIALEESVALRLFGTEDPIGKVIDVDKPRFRLDNNSRPHRVTAVYKKPDFNTALRFPALFVLDENDPTLPAMFATNWYEFLSMSFIKLKKGVDIAAIESRLPQFVDTYVPPTNRARTPSDFLIMAAQNIGDIHLTPGRDGEDTPSGSRLTVMIFFGVSVLVVVIGSINFVVLTTARASQRAREVVMRKVVGARQRQVMVQYLGESLLIALLATLGALALVELTLPIFNGFQVEPLSISYTSPATYGVLLGIIVIVGLLGGYYPALLLSRFKPAKVLSANSTHQAGGSAGLRHLLVVFQFTVSITLIIATIGVYTQAQYVDNRNPGYNQNNLLVLEGLFRPAVQPKVDLLQKEIVRVPGVVESGLSVKRPNGGTGLLTMVRRPGDAEDVNIGFQVVDFGFFSTYQIPLLAGRLFSENHALDRVDTERLGETELAAANVILNRSAVSQLGFASPTEAIGQSIVVRIAQAFQSESFTPTRTTVVGVVGDTQFQSMRRLPRAEVYWVDPSSTTTMTVRYEGDPQQVRRNVEQLWTRIMGNDEIELSFVDQIISQEFAQEKQQANLLVGFAVLAVVIACLGLYGLAAFTVNRRTKEIGLRKVMGAKVKQLVFLLVWQFSKPVMIANLLAWPAAIWGLLLWLERFPYRIGSWLLPLFCLLAGLIALLIAWLTVVNNVRRVANNKPIHALRYE